MKNHIWLALTKLLLLSETFAAEAAAENSASEDSGGGEREKRAADDHHHDHDDDDYDDDYGHSSYGHLGHYGSPYGYGHGHGYGFSPFRSFGIGYGGYGHRGYGYGLGGYGYGRVGYGYGFPLHRQLGRHLYRAMVVMDMVVMDITGLAAMDITEDTDTARMASTKGLQMINVQRKAINPSIRDTLRFSISASCT